jgi:hypothetical protein
MDVYTVGVAEHSTSIIEVYRGVPKESLVPPKESAMTLSSGSGMTLYHLFAKDLTDAKTKIENHLKNSIGGS